MHIFANYFQATVASILKNLKIFDNRSKIHTNLSARVRIVFFNVINVPRTFHFSQQPTRHLPFRIIL